MQRPTAREHMVCCGASVQQEREIERRARLVWSCLLKSPLVALALVYKQGLIILVKGLLTGRDWRAVGAF